MKKVINNLIKDLPPIEKPLEIDLVLDSGAFNGMYMYGALIYIKQLEKKGYIKVGRISGASVGSGAALFYLIDELDLMLKLSKIAKKSLIKHQNLNVLIKKTRSILEKKLKNVDLNTLNDRLFITYNDINTNKYILKNKYKTKDEVIDVICRSSYLPYLIDGNMTYNKKYADGVVPYFFKNTNKSVLFINLNTLNRIKDILIIKNETTFYRRIMEGILETHNFMLTKKSNNLCCLINKCNLSDIINIRIRYIIRVLFVSLLHYIEKKIMIYNLDNNFIYKNMSLIMKYLLDDLIFKLIY